MVKNLPVNEEATGSIPGPRKLHMLRSNYAITPQLLSLWAWSPGSAASRRSNEKPMDHNWRVASA